MVNIDITKFLTKNKFSRPGILLSEVLAIVVHWVANPGTTAQQTGNYFNSLAKQNKKIDRYASAHFTVDKSEIVQHIPLNEIAYHVGARKNKYTTFIKERLPSKYFTNNPITPNYCTIGIEVCHPTWRGNFEKETIENLTDLLAKLCFQFDLEPMSQIIRHYDVTMKLCPKYYVENPVVWENIKLMVMDKLGGLCHERKND